MAAASVCSLAFPYNEIQGSTTQLTKLILTDVDDICRYSITIQDGQCTNIESYYTKTMQPIDTPLKFVSNKSELSPLLLNVPPDFCNLKLHLTVSRTTKDNENPLTIIKSHGDDNDPASLHEYLLLDDYSLNSRYFSKIPLSKFIIGDEPETIVLNDSYDARALSNRKLNISIWKQASNDFQFLLSFQLWVDKLLTDSTSTTPNLKNAPTLGAETAEISSSTFAIPELRKAYNFSIEDGPEFRSVLNKYEQHMPKLKKSMQALQDEVRIMDSSLRRILSSRLKLLDIIDSLIDMQFNPLLRKLGLVKRLSWQFLLMFDPIEQNVGMLLKEVLNVSVVPKLLGFINSVIPQEGSELSSSKKAFEKNSKEYYEWLNKYLSNEKDRPELKLLLKRKSFELSKFDYLNTLNVATNNQYFNQFLENIVKFSHINVNNYGILDFRTYKDRKSSQQLLSNDDMLYLNSLSRFNSEKLQLRQMIEACRTNVELTNLIKNNSLNPSKADDPELSPVGDEEFASSEATGVKLDLIFPALGQASSVISLVNLTSTSEESGQMSGILYALGGKGKPGWHKEWVVLRDGQLMEFSDWRKGRLPINKPVDIALSNIKATTHDKRQYCFEIITSRNQKHVFQAMNNDERNQWMKSLYNAGQITLNLTEPAPKTLKKPGRIRTKFDYQLPPQMLSPNELNRLSSPVSILSSTRLPAKNVDCLELVRSIEGSKNDVCADCGSSDSVEWVSTNLLVVVCVQCSSCHRNMGSHISKVRSLKLDNFTDEALVLLEYVNNTIVNGYLQNTNKRISPDAEAEERLSYIQQKYIQKAYMMPFSDIDSALVEALRKIDIFGVIKCLNCGADPNLRLQVGSTSQDSEPTIISLFEYSLRKALKVDELGNSKDYFVISELLLLHGCNIEQIDRLNSAFRFSDEARAYWEKKRLRVV